MKKTYYNGYRCSCCEQSYEESNEYDTLKKALEEYPEIPPKNQQEYKIKEVIITNNENQEEIAALTVDWIHNPQNRRYNYTQYYGYKGSEDYFCIVVKGDSEEVIDKSWDEINKDVILKDDENKIRRLKEQLAEAVKGLNYLKINVKVEFEKDKT